MKDTDKDLKEYFRALSIMIGDGYKFNTDTIKANIDRIAGKGKDSTEMKRESNNPG